jgi:hypothetical protein
MLQDVNYIRSLLVALLLGVSDDFAEETPSADARSQRGAKKASEASRPWSFGSRENAGAVAGFRTAVAPVAANMSTAVAVLASKSSWADAASSRGRAFLGSPSGARFDYALGVCLARPRQPESVHECQSYNRSKRAKNEVARRKYSDEADWKPRHQKLVDGQ